MADNSIKTVNKKVLNLLKDSGADGLHIDDIVYLLGYKAKKELNPRLRDLKGRGEIKEVEGGRWKLIENCPEDPDALPKIHLPGDEKFSSYKNTLQDYCLKKHLGVPNYKPDRDSVGLIGTVTFSDTHVRCKDVSGGTKEADHRAAFEALKQLGYLKNATFELVPSQHKRKADDDFTPPPMKQSKSLNKESVTFKSKLNDYAQKKQLTLPMYDTVAVNDGFFSTVYVDNNKFKGMSTCQKRKDAEQSAAQVALNALIGIPLSGESISIGEADVTKMVTEARQASQPVEFKSRLQEMCTKLGKDMPTYETKANDSDDAYQSTVTVHGVQYIGPFVKRKKNAEGKAAEEALKALESMI